MHLMQAQDMSIGDTISSMMGIVFTDKGWSERPIHEVRKWLIPPALENQVIIGLEDDNAVGFITWAMIDSEEVGNAIDGKNWTDADWDTGGLFWIMDFVAVPGHGDTFALALRSLAKEVGLPTNWWRGRHERMGGYSPKEVAHE